MVNFVKSLKSGKILKNLKKYFTAGNEKWKILGKSALIGGKWKNLVKSVKKW